MAKTGAEDPEATATAILRGSESHIIGGVSAVSEASAAIALSQGGFKKRYSHTDPNEDAAAFALGEAGVLLAVADGHNGCDAAEATLDELYRRLVQTLEDTDYSFEIVTVDDGSTDSSLEILQELREQDPRPEHHSDHEESALQGGQQPQRRAAISEDRDPPLQ